MQLCETPTYVDRSLTIGSLFAGVGGLEHGLERAGLGPVLWQVEIDPFCRQVLAKHWPGATRYEDIRGVAALPAVDLICGGFPCQDISNAGKRTGLDGERSGLWSEYARIIRLVRPRFVVVENVAALLARGMGRVLADLAACGYDAQWDCIPASAVGAPHQRDRLFILAWHVSDAERDGGGQLSERQQRQGRGVRAPERWDAHVAHVREAMADGHGRGREGERLACRESGHEGAPGHEPDGPGGARWPPAPDDMLAWGRVPALAQPSICRLADGLPAGLVRDRTRALKAYGNAVVPAVAEVVGRLIREMI
jgi:DNA (cytosine-5)-methyltransferase 1